MSIRGTVVRVSSVQPLVTQLAFVCNKCRSEQTKVQLDGDELSTLPFLTYLQESILHLQAVRVMAVEASLLVQTVYLQIPKLLVRPSVVFSPGTGCRFSTHQGARDRL